MSMAGFAFRRRAEHRGDVVVAFDVGLLREIQIASVGLRLARERGLQVVFRLAAFERHLSLSLVRLLRLHPSTTGRRPYPIYGSGCSVCQHVRTVLGNPPISCDKTA